jgi:hypothetical protein
MPPESTPTPTDEVCWSGDGFGLAVISDTPLLVPGRKPRCGEPLELIRVSAETLKQAWQAPSAEVLWQTRFPDGAQVTVERSAQDEHRVCYGDRALYELSADRRLVRWALDGGEAANTAAQRFLLDTVLWWTALARGFELLHASSVILGDQLIAILGPTGAGKTSLAIELMNRGATLFCDDVLTLRHESTGVVAYPGPAVMNVPDASLHLAQGWATPIAPFADQHETWMAIDRAARTPAPPSAAIIIDRAPQNDLSIHHLPQNPLTLIPWTWGLTNIGPSARKSFQIFANLAEHIPAYHLSAPTDIPPAVIAELITSRVSHSPTEGEE